MAAPITIERFITELEKMSTQMHGTGMGSGEYDRKLARVIGELRERGVEGDRTEITAALDAAQEKGVITPAVREHLNNRLGLD